MSEQVNATAVDDILTNDLSGVDTRNPLLPKGRVKFTIAKCELLESDKNGVKKKRISIQLKLNQTTTSTDGQVLNAGTMFFDNIHITPTEKMDRTAIEKNLKRFQLACSVNGPFHPLNQYEGRQIEADVTISPAQGDYAEQNRFRYIDPSTGKAA